MEKLDLSLPGQSKENDKKPFKILIALSIIILVSIFAGIAIILMQSGEKALTKKNTGLTPEAIEQVALKLEKQGLNNAAVSEWKEYMGNHAITNEKAAKIWYRIAKLYQRDNQYEKALDGFYRSESFSKIPDISTDISRRIQDCLESLGKFSALRYELADRVGLNHSTSSNTKSKKGDQVLAQIGLQKITKSDIDRMIEQKVENRLSQLKSYLPPDRIRKEKERLLKQFSTSSQRKMFLNRFVFEEILYRKAGEEKLIKDPDLSNQLKDREREFLAQKMIEKQFLEKINITTGDLKTYYDAHKNDYVQPERAKIAWILLKNQKQADKVLARLKKGEDFGKLAKKLSMDQATQKTAGKISGWIEKTSSTIPSIGKSGEALQIIFSTEAEKIAEKTIKTDRGVGIIKVLERKPEQQKDFNEVENEVYRALRSQKEREIQYNLLDQLKRQYDVVIHQSAFSEKETTKK